MKTLKVGALALAMMFAGSVMAMQIAADNADSALNACKALFGDFPALVTDEQRVEFATIDRTITQAKTDQSIKKLEQAKEALELLRKAIEFKQSRLGKIVLQTMAFIKTHPKKLGLLAAVAVLTVAYVAYKKYTAKKKMHVEAGDEDEAVEITVE